MESQIIKINKYQTESMTDRKIKRNATQHLIVNMKRLLFRLKTVEVKEVKKEKCYVYEIFCARRKC